MQSVIGALRVNLGLDSAKFSKGMSKAQRDLAKAQKSFLAFSAVGAAAFGAITIAALRGADGIDKAAKASRRLGASIGGFKAAQLAASELGVAASTLTDNLQTMNREIAKGSAGAARSLAALNLTVAELSGLDADEKLAVIADRVKGLGINADDASVILQELGVRNREMVLAVLEGGDVFRNARKDVQDYGLAISDVDASSIEAANDQIGRLSIISEYAGQQLALKFVPALGAMAQAMTDSLREGGTLRKVIDGLVASLDAIAIATSGIAVSLGARYVAAMVAATSATGVFTTAVNIARAATIALGGPLGVVWGLIGAAAGAWVLFKDNTDKAATEVFASSAAMRELNALLGDFYTTAAPESGKAAIEYANNMRKQAKAVRDAARAEIALQEAELARFLNAPAEGREGGVLMGDAEERALRGNLAATRADLDKAQADLYKAERAAKRTVTAVTGAMSETMTDTSTAAKDLAVNVDLAMTGLSGGAAAAAPELEKIEPIINRLSDQISGPLTSAVDSVSDAFGDFVMRGFKDFKSFARSIVDSFKDMIRQMIVTAAKNKIMISLGMGGSFAGGMAQAGGIGSALSSMSGVGGALGALGTFGSSIGTGLSLVGSGFGAGGLGGAATAGMGAITGGIGAGGAMGLGTALGAAIPFIGAAALAIGLFGKKTKELDSGLRVAVKGLDVFAETFKTIQTSRFFGLSKKTSTSATADPNNPIIGAVNAMQTTALEAARVLGVGATAFADFSYDFKLSLKGLTEDQRISKINEELGKMGDEFASLVPNVGSLNDLLARANAIGASIRALTDTQGLFATRQEAVFAASQAGNLSAGTDTTQGLLRDLIRAVREGDVNNGRLTAQLVAIQQRQELAPT